MISIPIRDDLEVLVVDDNSQNVTSDDWKQFQKDYPHVHLFLTTEGKGAGYARNVGLSHAVGEWAIFADADDFFYPDAFNQLDKWSDSDMDIIYFVCDSRNGTTLAPCSDRMPGIRQSIKERNIGRLRFNSLVPWGKMIRRSLIEEHYIRFDEVEVSNDVMFSMRVGLYVQNADVIEMPLYCCTNNAGSLVFHHTIERAKIRCKVYKNANDFLHHNGLDHYRMPFDRSVYPHMKIMLHNRPDLFLKYLWRIRYKDDFSAYFKDVALLGWNKSRLILSNKTNSRVHKSRNYIKHYVAKILRK